MSIRRKRTSCWSASTIPKSFAGRARDGGVLLRNFGWQVPGCVRITIGDAAQNDQLLNSLRNA